MSVDVELSWFRTGRVDHSERYEVRVGSEWVWTELIDWDTAALLRVDKGVGEGCERLAVKVFLVKIIIIVTIIIIPVSENAPSRIESKRGSK